MFRLLNLSKTFAKVNDLTIVAKGLKTGVQPVIAKMPLVKNYGEIEINHPLEAMLGALVTCETHTAFYHAKKDGFDLKQIDWNKVTSKIDVQPWIKGVEAPKTFEDINIEVEVTSSATQEEVEKFFKKVEIVCPVYRTFIAAGVNINTKITTKKP